MTYYVGTPEERFWRNVKKGAGCWEWKGGINSTGRGIFWLNGKTPKAHRYSYELHNGAIPEGKIVLHKCDNGKCVRPSHLYAGTYKQNSADMWSRGRGVGNRRLTAKQYAEIQTAWKPREITQKQLAERFGVHVATIQRVCASA